MTDEWSEIWRRSREQSVAYHTRERDIARQYVDGRRGRLYERELEFWRGQVELHQQQIDAIRQRQREHGEI